MLQGYIVIRVDLCGSESTWVSSFKLCNVYCIHRKLDDKTIVCKNDRLSWNHITKDRRLQEKWKRYKLRSYESGVSLRINTEFSKPVFSLVKWYECKCFNKEQIMMMCKKAHFKLYSAFLKWNIILERNKASIILGQ